MKHCPEIILGVTSFLNPTCDDASASLACTRSDSPVSHHLYLSEGFGPVSGLHRCQAGKRYLDS